MTKELQSIAALPGVTGLCLHRGAGVLHHSLPDTWGDAGAADLCHAVVSAFVAYAGADRPLTQGYFQYPESGVLVLTAAPRNQPEPDPAADFFLTFLISDPAALTSVIAPSRAFLGRQARMA